MSRAQDRKNKFVTLLISDIEKERDNGFHGGTLAALDVVYLHDQQVIAAEIVNATDNKALLLRAVKDGYHNLAALKRTIREQNRRRTEGTAAPK